MRFSTGVVCDRAFYHITKRPKVFELLSRFVYSQPTRGSHFLSGRKKEQPCFSVDAITRIIERSPQPYKTVWRLVAETGIRRAKICGLNVGDVEVNRRIIVVQRSRTKKGVLKPTKAGVRNGSVKRRVFSFSPSLAEQLRPFVEGRTADQPLFLTPGRVTKNGKRIGGDVRLEPDNFVKRD
jgi:integrase